MPQTASNTSSRGPNEDLRSVESLSRVQDKKHEDHEVKKVAESFAGEAKTEVLGLDESAETNDKVSEVLSNSKDLASTGGGKKAYASASKKEIEALRVKLLKNLPSEKAMKRQVEHEIRKEIKYLRGKAMGLIRPSYNSMSFFEMANLLRKIRELKGILYSLVKISFERLKTLWLRFVHGIM
jgi:hypothetical protein